MVLCVIMLKKVVEENNDNNATNMHGKEIKKRYIKDVK
jgi:hypothetical protein